MSSFFFFPFQVEYSSLSRIRVFSFPMRAWSWIRWYKRKKRKEKGDTAGHSFLCFLFFFCVMRIWISRTHSAQRFFFSCTFWKFFFSFFLFGSGAGTRRTSSHLFISYYIIIITIIYVFWCSCWTFNTTCTWRECALSPSYKKKKQKRGKAFFSLYLFCFDGFIRCIMEWVLFFFSAFSSFAFNVQSSFSSPFFFFCIRIVPSLLSTCLRAFSFFFFFLFEMLTEKKKVAFFFFAFVYGVGVPPIPPRKKKRK